MITPDTGGATPSARGCSARSPGSPAAELTRKPQTNRLAGGAGGWRAAAGGGIGEGGRLPAGVGGVQRHARRDDLVDPVQHVVVEELIKIAADAGCSLIHLALAFVTAHPAVTSAIIGPRIMDQLTDQLAGASVALDDDVLDRIDQIVPPGVTLNAADAGWQPPALAEPAARRRPPASRAAS